MSKTTILIDADDGCAIVATIKGYIEDRDISEILVNYYADEYNMEVDKIDVEGDSFLVNFDDITTRVYVREIDCE